MYRDGRARHRRRLRPAEYSYDVQEALTAT